MEQQFDNIEWCLDYFSRASKISKQESESESESQARETQQNDSIHSDFENESEEQKKPVAIQKPKRKGNLRKGVGTEEFEVKEEKSVTGFDNNLKKTKTSLALGEQASDPHEVAEVDQILEASQESERGRPDIKIGHFNSKQEADFESSLKTDYRE